MHYAIAEADFLHCVVITLQDCVFAFLLDFYIAELMLMQKESEGFTFSVAPSSCFSGFVVEDVLHATTEAFQIFHFSTQFTL